MNKVFIFSGDLLVDVVDCVTEAIAELIAGEWQDMGFKVRIGE